MPIGAMIVFLVEISNCFITNIIGRQMLFKVGERSENCFFEMNYNCSVNWIWSLNSNSWKTSVEFSGCFEWNDYFCIYCSHEHWKCMI